MHFAARVLVAVATLTSLGLCQERRFSTYKWAVKVPYGNSVNISCVLWFNETQPLVNLDRLSVIAWHAPSGREISRSNSDTRLRVTGASDEVLSITNVQEGDRGVYTCKFTTADRVVRYHKHGLNLNGPLYSSMFDQYKQNLVIGGSAAGAMLVLVSILCGVHTICCSKQKDS